MVRISSEDKTFIPGSDSKTGNVRVSVLRPLRKLHKIISTTSPKTTPYIPNA